MVNYLIHKAGLLRCLIPAYVNVELSKLLENYLAAPVTESYSERTMWCFLVNKHSHVDRIDKQVINN